MAVTNQVDYRKRFTKQLEDGNVAENPKSGQKVRQYVPPPKQLREIIPGERKSLADQIADVNDNTQTGGAVSLAGTVVTPQDTGDTRASANAAPQGALDKANETPQPTTITPLAATPHVDSLTGIDPLLQQAADTIGDDGDTNAGGDVVTDPLTDL